MNTLSELIILATSLLIVGVTAVALPRNIKAVLSIATLLMVSVVGFSQPSFADTNENVLTQEQREFNETLRTSPLGTQYEGLEYVKEIGRSQSDRQIEQEIRSKIPNNLKFSVSNGSVRLSGKVQNLRTAQNLVQDVKNIAGVHEISYDLGLEEKA